MMNALGQCTPVPECVDTAVVDTVIDCMGESAKHSVSACGGSHPLVTRAFACTCVAQDVPSRLGVECSDNFFQGLWW
jgi:hypothetical protein